jgi:DNA-binding CsgD family transcriptional regulator
VNLLPSVQLRALHLRSLRNEAEAIQRGLAVLPFGMIRLDEDQRVIDATARAIEISRDLRLFVIANTIAWRNANDAKKFENCWHRDLGVRHWFSTRTDNSRPVVIAVHRLSFSPLPGILQWPGVVSVWSIGHSGRLSDDVLKRAFGLTRSEARLTRVLFESLELSVAARRSGITVGSARSYLKRIFAKTGTTRQAQLISLLSVLAEATQSGVPGPNKE